VPDAVTTRPEAHRHKCGCSTRAHADAERVHAELEQGRAEQNAELDRHRATVLADLAERRAALEAEVARLGLLEQQYRDRMRSYLNGQLALIESNAQP
jgi:hypothetical protein